jgi:AcrR family transcriptional regulator
MVQTSNNGSSAADRARRRVDARRLEILRAAGRTFRRRGFAEAGMREIAAEADLSPGNLYHYFQGKHEILYFCQERTLEKMLSSLRSARQAGGPAARQLRTVLTAHARCILDELEGTAAHLEVDALPPDLRRRIVSSRDTYEREVRSLIESGMATGELARRDAGLVTRAVLGALNGTVRWFHPEGPTPAATVAAELADYLVAGLTASPASGHESTGPVPSEPPAGESPNDS